MEIEIKRVNRRHKSYIQLRENNKVVQNVRVQKGFSVKKARELYKRQNSIDKNTERYFLKNVVEWKTTNNYIPKGKYQAFITSYFKTVTISARSQQHSTDYSKKLSFYEAQDNMDYRIAQAFGEEYDKTIGEAIRYDQRPKVISGFIYYMART